MSQGVAFIRGQHTVTDDDMLVFAKQLGGLEGPHPVYSPDPSSSLCVINHDPKRPRDSAEWHSDCSWSRTPPWSTILWPRLLPLEGGDTLWLSSAAAYDALSPGMKLDLRELHA